MPQRSKVMNEIKDAGHCGYDRLFSYNRELFLNKQTLGSEYLYLQP